MRKALRFAGAVFAIMGFLHVIRLMFRVPLVAGTFIVPQWMSVIGAMVLLLLALWMFESSRCQCK